MRREHPAICTMGDGVVGGALRAWLESRGLDVRPYDPPKGLDDRAVLERAGVVFVCVPTPYTEGVGFDDRHLEAAVRAIPGEKTVVIKSTVLPGTTERLQRRFPQHRFLFNPEFLREVSAVEDMMRPDRQIVGFTPRSRGEAELIMSLLPPAPFTRICPASEAEMAKYVANSFLAVKVSYANEIYDLCETLAIGYEDVRDIVAADSRIGASHMNVFDAGYRGYGGKCLPKDSKSLIDLASSAGIELQVLRATDAVNEAIVARRQPVQRELRLVIAQPKADEAEAGERAA